MRQMIVDVQNKIAAKKCRTVYVCGNSDYVIRFGFDEEWSGYDKKTARFEYDGKYQDVVFTGNECPVPIISDTYSFNVGVFAGDLCTTTPAYIPCKKSILCGAGVPADPMPEVYNQIISLLNGLSNGTGGFSPDNAGMLVYIGSNGKLFPLSLGYGLEIADGVLRVTDIQIVRAVCGKARCGETVCGEV